MRILVLAGGPGPERAVSLGGGAAVADALAGRGHDVERLDPGDTVAAAVGNTRALTRDRADAVFLALHGPFGEDGTVQRVLNEIGLPFTGSGAAASARAFEKLAAKAAFLAAGVPTPDRVRVGADGRAVEADGRALEEVSARLGFPLVVKPSRGGSSVGVSLVRGPAGWDDAVTAARDAGGGSVFAERFIAGEEWSVPLEGRDPLPALRIATDRPFFDYTAKYADAATRFEFPPDSAVRRAVVDAAVRAAASLGTAGLVRVDLRVDGDGRPWVLEVNTTPGFGPSSQVPRAARRAGLEPGLLYERAVTRASA